MATDPIVLDEFPRVIEPSVNVLEVVIRRSEGPVPARLLRLPPADAQAGRFRQRTDKRLYVSPFMDMDMTYDFKGQTPGDTLALVINGSDSEGLLIATSMNGARRPMSDRALIAAALVMPLLTLKVVAAIHWEALKLWLKRVPLTRKPAPPPDVLDLRHRG